MKTKDNKTDKLVKSKNIVLWGAGYHTEEVLRFYKSFFDSRLLQITDKNKAGEQIVGHPILEAAEVDFESADLIVIMTAIYHNEVECILREQYKYTGCILGLYEFRRAMLQEDSYEECRCHIDDFIKHMERGMASYSYDYMFQEKYGKYKKIKVFGLWASSIGESIRYLLTYYDFVFKTKKADEYYLLIPYIKGNDFANGRFLENVSRTMPMVTYENCHFWKYVMERYPQRFDLENYNDYNGILVDQYNQFDERIPQGIFGGVQFPILSYTVQEMAEAQEKLKKMQLKGEYVCIFARDNAYLEKQYSMKASYSGNALRDININSYKTAAEYLKERGITAVRMGKVVSKCAELPNCIDYASEFHDDFMDLYLCGHCKFFVGNLSGIVELAHIQNTPTVILGVAQLGMNDSLNGSDRDIIVPKKIYDRRNNRFLKFTEMWDIELWDSKVVAEDKMRKYYEERGYEVIELTQDEIKDAIVEMNEKIDGIYVEDETDKELQRKYHELFERWIEKNNYNYSYFLHANISSTFLRKNSYLLEEF